MSKIPVWRLLEIIEKRWKQKKESSVSLLDKEQKKELLGILKETISFKEALLKAIKESPSKGRRTSIKEIRETKNKVICCYLKLMWFAKDYNLLDENSIEGIARIGKSFDKVEANSVTDETVTFYNNQFLWIIEIPFKEALK